MMSPSAAEMQLSARGAAAVIGKVYLQRYEAPIDPAEQEIIRNEAIATLSIGVREALSRWGFEGNVDVFRDVLAVASVTFFEVTRELWLKPANDRGGAS